MLSMPGAPREKPLDPRMVRKNDTSAKSMHEWMGVLTVDIEEAPSMSIPATVSPLGNYAAQIQWEDGFNQVLNPHPSCLAPKTVPGSGMCACVSCAALGPVCLAGQGQR